MVYQFYEDVVFENHNNMGGNVEDKASQQTDETQHVACETPQVSCESPQRTECNNQFEENKDVTGRRKQIFDLVDCLSASFAHKEFIYWDLYSKLKRFSDDTAADYDKRSPDKKKRRYSLTS